jgi:hypothetical protein
MGFWLELIEVVGFCSGFCSMDYYTGYMKTILFSNLSRIRLKNVVYYQETVYNVSHKSQAIGELGCLAKYGKM